MTRRNGARQDERRDSERSIPHLFHLLK